MMQHRFLQTDGPDPVVEPSCFIANVVYGFASFNVLIVRTAIKHNVAVEVGFPAIGVIGDFIGPKNEGAIGNPAANVKLKNRPILFLLHSTNIHFVAIRTGGRRRGREQLRGKGGWDEEVSSADDRGPNSSAEEACERPRAL